jgi:nicotinamidase-related amidase
VLCEFRRRLLDGGAADRLLVRVLDAAREADIMSALTTEVCLVFPAISAVRAGYEVYAVLDASGAWSKR